MTQLAYGLGYSFIALLLLTWIGNVACRILFWTTGLKPRPEDAPPDIQPAGWIIGWLERLVLAIGIIAHSWEVLAAVIALKTVARFKELNDQRFAEYFLVGSLFSLLWAVIITGGWLAYDHHMGIDLRARLGALYGHETPIAE